MKKIFILSLSVAALFATASCQKSEVTGGETNVTIHVGMPGTKAISDGKTATDLFYEVYHVNPAPTSATDTLQIATGKTTMENLSAALSFSLMRGSKYVVLFWAQSPNAPYGSTPNLQAIPMNYATPVNGNDENRDAFAGKIDLNIAADDEKNNFNCELKRPFSQLNFVSKDYTKPLTFGTDATTGEAIEIGTLSFIGSSITVTGLATTYDVMDTKATLTGTASGNHNVTFNATTLINETFDNSSMEDKTWVSMNYLLFPTGTTTAVISAEFKAYIKYNNQVDNVVNQPLSTYYNNSVPVAPNYRTNVVGDLFSEDGSVTATINPAYDGTNTGDQDGFEN